MQYFVGMWDCTSFLVFLLQCFLSQYSPQCLLSFLCTRKSCQLVKSVKGGNINIFQTAQVHLQSIPQTQTSLYAHACLLSIQGHAKNTGISLINKKVSEVEKGWAAMRRNSSNLIFPKACMFWEEFFLAALTSLNLGLEAGPPYLSTRMYHFKLRPKICQDCGAWKQLFLHLHHTTLYCQYTCTHTHRKHTHSALMQQQQCHLVLSL